MHDIEVGIPVLTEIKLALEKARQLRSSGFDGQIHISVNKGLQQEHGLVQEELKPLRISIHEFDMGLYENFRFLMNAANSEFFAWVAVDDLPDVRYWEEFADENCDLLLGELLFHRKRSSGNDYEEWSFTPSNNTFVNIPGNIFGLWRLDFLRKIYPPGKAFDWLDTYLLLAASRMGRVNWFSNASSTITVREGEPHRVNGKFHLPFGYFLHSLKLLAHRGFSVEDVTFLLRGMLGRVIFSLREFRSFYFSR